MSMYHYGCKNVIQLWFQAEMHLLTEYNPAVVPGDIVQIWGLWDWGPKGIASIKREPTEPQG